MTIVVLAAAAGVSSSDVPGRYDVIIDGAGYVLADSIEPSVPFRTHRAIYSFSPTFIERTNTTGNFGDNQQAFWLTASQNDWSLGEQQKFYRLNDEDRRRRFWRGSNIDVRNPGQVTLRNATKSLTFAAAVGAAVGRSATTVAVASSTNLYTVDNSGTISDQGAHGLGIAPARFGIATDGNRVYLASTAGGTVGVRKWNGSAFSTFSANGADSLEFLNNILYGYRADSNGDLVSYSTGGVLTSVFTWKYADGTVVGGDARLKSYGGQLFILRLVGKRASELWIYDGTGVKIVWEAPPNFVAWDIEVVDGVAFIGGTYQKSDASGNILYRPAIYTWADGAEALLWDADDFSASLSPPALANFDGGLAFTDDYTARIVFYTPSTGGVHGIGTYTVAGSNPILAPCQYFVLHTRNQTGGYQHPDRSTAATSGTVDTSLIDFESSLPKTFRAVVADADLPAGASVDLAYQLESLTGAYTSIATSITSGQEYTLNQSGRAIGLRVTLNKGTAATGPTLKRVYVRASPILQQFRLNTYILDLTGGKGGYGPRTLRDGMPDPLTGRQKLNNLIVSAKKTTPITITDRLGTYTGIIELDKLDVYEEHPGDVYSSGEFLVRLDIREV